MTAVDVGARIVAFDSEGRVVRIEEAGRRFAAEVGLALEMGEKPDAEGLAEHGRAHGRPSVRGDFEPAA